MKPFHPVVHDVALVALTARELRFLAVHTLQMPVQITSLLKTLRANATLQTRDVTQAVYMYAVLS